MPMGHSEHRSGRAAETLRGVEVRNPPAQGAPSAFVRRVPKRTTAPAAPSDPPSAAQPDTAEPAEESFSSALNAMLGQTLAATFRFTPEPAAARQDVVLHVTGRRLDVRGAPRRGDRFTHDEVVENVLAGSGPVAVTVKLGDVNPGRWDVSARMLSAAGSNGTDRAPTALEPIPVERAVWSWRRWRLADAPDGPVASCPTPLVRVPAVLLGGYLAMVTLGITLALVLQAVLLSARHVAAFHPLLLGLGTVATGLVGGKTWYQILNRREGASAGPGVLWLAKGWAVQGFLTGAAIATAALLALTGTAAGPYLDTTAPALMLGLGVGRIGCLLAGCCSGRTSASRFALWSSDQRLGMRRIPVPLMESALCLLLGSGALAALTGLGPAHGTILLGALAAYTLVRQGLLRLRAAPRASRLGSPLIAGAAAAVLIADLAALALWRR